MIPERGEQRFPQIDVQCLNTEAMAMGKLHKEIGHLIVKSAEDVEKSDSQVIKVRGRPNLSVFSL